MYAIRSYYVLIAGVSINYWLVILLGLIAGNTIAFATEYYTSYTDKPTQTIAEACQTGAATTIIHGFAVGMMSTVITSYSIHYTKLYDNTLISVTNEVS